MRLFSQQKSFVFSVLPLLISLIFFWLCYFWTQNATKLPQTKGFLSKDRHDNQTMTEDIVINDESVHDEKSQQQIKNTDAHAVIIMNTTNNDSSARMDDQHDIIIIVEKLAKPWPTVSNDNFTWCIPRPRINNQHYYSDKDDSIVGLLYVKSPKAASSTGAGVTLQISKNVAERKGYSNQICAMEARHGTHFYRRKDPNIMWTMIRDPAKRSISHYFFNIVSQAGHKFNSQKAIEFLLQKRNHQIKYIADKEGSIIISQTENNDTLTTEQIMMTTQTIIQNQIMNVYNFVGLVERMDESLVVLQMLLGLQDEDIIVLSAKQSGGYDAGVVGNKCHFLHKSFTTPEMDEYIENEFKDQNSADYLLYDIVNKSLDMTIDMLGRDIVEAKVRRHQELKDVATRSCASKAIFPCSDTGKKQLESEFDCLCRDFACGYKCVANVLGQYNRKNDTLDLTL